MFECASSPNPEFAAYVAVDWADRKHCWALLPAAGGKTETGELINTPEAIAEWAARLADRFGGHPVAVALEQKRGAVVHMLRRHSHLVLFTVRPGMSASFRHAFYPSGAKSDPGDTALLLELLLHHRERLQRYEPDDEKTRLLALLTEQRRKTVGEKTKGPNVSKPYQSARTRMGQTWTHGESFQSLGKKRLLRSAETAVDVRRF